MFRTWLRSGLWRFALFAALWFASGHILWRLVEFVYHFSDTGFTPVDILVYKIADAIFMLAVNVLLTWSERRRVSWIGLNVTRDSSRLFLVGSLWAFVMLTVLVLVTWLCGYAHFQGLAEQGADFWKYLAIWLAAMAMVGLDEELQFRGYAQANLTHGVGFWPAALILSLAVAGEHMQKPMENVPDIFNILLFGLFFAYTVKCTGNLWFAIGFHASFDFFALSFFASPNTGNLGQPLEHHLLDLKFAGPAWLTGGPQGLEASFLIPVMLLVMGWMLYRRYPVGRYPPLRSH